MPPILCFFCFPVHIRWRNCVVSFKCLLIIHFLFLSFLIGCVESFLRLLLQTWANALGKVKRHHSKQSRLYTFRATKIVSLSVPALPNETYYKAKVMKTVRHFGTGQNGLWNQEPSHGPISWLGDMTGVTTGSELGRESQILLGKLGSYAEQNNIRSLLHTLCKRRIQVN